MRIEYVTLVSNLPSPQFVAFGYPPNVTHTATAPAKPTATTTTQVKR